MKMELTKFERARIIGARALQISMGAPILVQRPKAVYDPVIIAMMEFEKGRMPISIKRPVRAQEEAK